MSYWGFLSQKDAVTIAIHDGVGRWLMMLRDDKPGIYAPGVWALIGGGVDVGESYVNAARREAWEEISATLSIPELIHVGTIMERPVGRLAPKVQPSILFLNNRPVGHESVVRVNEGQDHRWFRLGEMTGQCQGRGFLRCHVEAVARCEAAMAIMQWSGGSR